MHSINKKVFNIYIEEIIDFNFNLVDTNQFGKSSKSAEKLYGFLC